jgi:hypothetical protein
MKNIRKLLAHFANFSLNQLRVSNLGDYGSPRWRLQLVSRLRQIKPIATLHDYLGKLCTSLKPPCTLEQNNSSEYKEFLCDYRFKGEEYCISIMATSWEEVEQRLRCIAGNGKIMGGPVAFTLEIPFT